MNAPVEELIDYYKHTASDEPSIEEQLKAKLQQKLDEIKLEPDPYKDTNPKIIVILQTLIKTLLLGKMHGQE